MKLLSLLLLFVTSDLSAEPADVRPYFSPAGGCTAAAVREIDAAKITIDFQAYRFTSADILFALERAISRGVHVRALYDRANKSDNLTLADDLARFPGGPPRLYSRSLIMHSKIIILDSVTVVSGSFNWTTSAEKSNDENLIVIRSDKVAAAYTAQFSRIMANAQK